MQEHPTPKYLDEKAVAKLTSFSLGKLRNDRLHSKGLPYRRVGRSIRYRLDEVLEFMEACTVQPEAV